MDRSKHLTYGASETVPISIFNSLGGSHIPGISPPDASLSHLHRFQSSDPLTHFALRLLQKDSQSRLSHDLFLSDLLLQYFDVLNCHRVRWIIQNPHWNGLTWCTRFLMVFQRLGNRSIHNMSKDAEHRVESDRFSWGSKASSGDSVNLLIDADEKREHGSGRKSGPLLSGTAYCISSCSMILLNKVVLSSYAFNAGISLMFYQNLISTVIVVVLGFCGLVSLEKLRWKLIKVWIPVNVIFVGMLVSGMYR
ncbi:golgi nucleotide sugar transporter 2 [Actinidia rufa]|uniref:Golgi nucleotide sugar transporter 2 n=1 Tax=Actinidia rufa TaxID=165716 RepID=A0A7J0FTY4_9ERIC|nr:golgi nucleotide sugar transporter 2 [Actinidia rufa]